MLMRTEKTNEGGVSEAPLFSFMFDGVAVPTLLVWISWRGWGRGGVLKEAVIGSPLSAGCDLFMPHLNTCK